MNTHADPTGAGSAPPVEEPTTTDHRPRGVPWKQDGYPAAVYGTCDASAARRFLGRTAITAALFLSVYALLFAAFIRFPYIGEGGRVVVNEKIRHITTAGIFPAAATNRIVIFGNSKTLSGFVPEQFDEPGQGAVYSYNMGLPDADEFVDVLEALVRAGNIPSEILITILWGDPSERNPLVLIHEDKALIERWFPFRYIARDFAIFLLRARHRGGIRALYRSTQSESEDVLIHRGYYFIAGQSRFPNDQLPNDFSYTTDTPDAPRHGRAPGANREFDRLMDLLQTHGIKAYIVPTYYREGQYAPQPQVPRDIVEALEDNPWIDVLSGPHYFLYPNRLFSDPVHVNPAGARAYTRDLLRVYSWHKATASSRTAQSMEEETPGM